ncbi:threonine--tRNA ligase [Entomospira culicis]|uniref:Threonine--tRNA ligase n=1 Tax=Entomospira culicis TaxID=2719989 RepID=A0A968GJA2_9SPIO|nr:threonine--tRNA ligase [Entomospira culicis]NIZ18660.1 threonine--tRNA ligase [Entomospira culicis]NIZ68875.1 threonine--tRNA ligase [Entomospira culicis]WDI37468.1 threonine--tRNA ligase [Entomospira culicis]WDI39096.1 threonine--tRNA ligase [Entomospira culicis]
MGNFDLATVRHSMAHVLAAAVQELYPTTLFAIGPAINEGFYYDMKLPVRLVLEDFPAIETKMREILGKNLAFVREEIAKEQALALFAHNPYKVEIIEELPADAVITIYRLGDFVDLCRGPHVESTADLSVDGFALLNLAGAYWRGDEKRDQLQRIYATAFASKAELDHHLTMLQEREKRDHRRIGKDLDLFSFHEEAGAGLAYWHPMGGRIRLVLEDFWRKEHIKHGYELIYTPHVGRSWLWETSGHLDFYKEGMYSAMDVDGQEYYAKPMNCPFHIMIYQNDKKSYRQLPCRWAELGTVYRYERAGALHGLMRVRGFTQDDAHIFCTPEQLADEVYAALQFSLHILSTFGFSKIQAFLSTQPKEKSVGEAHRWQEATDALRSALDRADLSFGVDEGGGAFYGPKIDLKIEDSMGREWQLSTIQLDFNMPERFKLTFIDRDGEAKRPYMVHRALLGSLERFFGVLTEHYAGAFPLWLAPIQVRIVPVSMKFVEYAQQVARYLGEADLRVSLDDGDDRMQAKIKRANELRIPYTIIVGGRDAENGTASMKIRGGVDKNDLSLAELRSYLVEKSVSKSLFL